jgi:hypothetical protein
MFATFGEGEGPKLATFARWGGGWPIGFASFAWGRSCIRRPTRGRARGVRICELRKGGLARVWLDLGSWLMHGVRISHGII